LNEKNGGIQGYEMLRDRNKSATNEIKQIMQGIDAKIAQTQQDDMEFMKNKVPGYMTFDQSNPSLVQNIIAVHGMFSNYQKMESDLEQEYSKNKQWLEKFSQKNINWEEYARSPELRGFIEQHKSSIDEIIKNADMIDKIESFLGKEFKEIVEVLESINIWDYVAKVSMREKTEKEVWEEMDSRVSEKFNKFESNSAKTVQCLDK